MKTLAQVSLYSIALLFAMTSCLGTSRKDKMLGLLAQAEKKNVEYVSLASDSTMADVLDYFMAHGNTDELVRANYIMGRLVICIIIKVRPL